MREIPVNEWQISRPPQTVGLSLDVWLTSGSVRRVVAVGDSLARLRFTDCSHPMQNAACDQELVVGWRVAGAPFAAQH